jgi:hypothetical protein
MYQKLHKLVGVVAVRKPSQMNCILTREHMTTDRDLKKILIVTLISLNLLKRIWRMALPETLCQTEKVDGVESQNGIK